MRLPLLLLFSTLAICSSPAWSQESSGLTTTVINGAALDTLLQQTEGDNPLRVVDSPDGQYGVFVLSSQPRPAPADGSVSGGYHSAVAEIYHVVRGTGIFVTGGELLDPVAVETDSARYTRAGPGESGRLNNAELVEYGPGSIFIVPPGVPHNATHAVTSDTDFLIYRFDPSRVLPKF